MMAAILRLCEGQPGLIVDVEDLFDGVDVGGRPEVKAQVVLARCAHDLLGSRTEHVRPSSFIGSGLEDDSSK